MQIILKYFKNLTPTQIEKFEKIGDLYRFWNEKINVISRKDIDNLYERHILHSLSIAKIINFKPQTKVLDVGTGGGFPGIPLAILFPEVEFFLCDSIGKKITIVDNIVEELNLKNVTAEKIRAEEINEKFDFVVTRAVAEIPSLMKWTSNKIKLESKNELKNGLICLKGGDLKEEVKGLKNNFEIFDINSFFEEEMFITKKIVHIFL